MNGRYIILLVDDSESDRGIYRRYLLADEGFDYQIIEAESLEEGLELWRSQSPDLVLTDIHLPDGSGLELLAAIKNTHPSSKIPIIMMTGQGDERLAVQAMKLGANDYLVKSDITASTLCHYVETAIAQWNLSGKLTELQQLNQELEIRVEERTHALEASQSFNRSILEAIPNLLLRLNRDGICLSYIPPKVNKDSFEPINQHISELLPPDLVERQLQAIEQALITRELQVYEHQVLKHNQITYEEIRILAINDQTVLAVVRDISDRKRAELENIRIRERFQFLLASSPTIIYSCKPDGDYGATFMSENVKALLGYTPEEFVAQENFWASHIHPEDAPQIFAELPALFDQGTHTHDYRFLHQDGHYLWLRDQLQLVKDDQGNPIEIVGSFSDISDRKIMEKNLEESRDKFQRLVDEMGEKFVVFSHSGIEGILNYASDGVHPIFGLTKEDVLGKNWADVVNWLPEELPRAKQRLIAMAQGKIDFHQPEMQFIHPDGGIRTIQISEHPIRNEAGEMIAIEGIVEDISDRKRTELEKQQLLQELSAFKSALDQSAIVVITDVKGVITYANNLFCEISGYSREELIGQTHRILRSGYHPPSFFQNLWRTIRSGEIWRGDICNRKKNGDLYWLGSTMIPFLDDKGEPFQYLAIRFDLTHRKQAEQSLKESQQFLQTLLDTLPLYVFWKNTESQFLGCNKPLVDLMGLSPTDGIADMSNISELEFSYNAVDLHRFKADDQEVIKSGQPKLMIEEMMTLPNGEQIWIEIQKAPLRDWMGNVIGLVGVFQDISDRKKAEEALNISEERFRNAFDTTAVGMCLVSSFGELLKVNPTLCNFWGYSETELLKMSFQDITHPDDLASDLELLWQLLAGEITHYNLEKRYLTKDQRLVWGYLSVSLVKDSQDQPLYFVSQIQDITIRKQAEIALQKSENLFRQIFDSNIVGMMFTDFNGLITGANDRFLEIIGYSREDLDTNQINWASMTPAEYHQLDLDAIEHLKRYGVIEPWEKAYLHKDGHLVHILVGVGLLSNEVNNCVCVIVDISDRKQAEQQLQNLTDRLTIALNSGAIGCWEWDIAHNVINWDERLYELHGVPLETTVLFETWANSVHPDDLQSAETLLQQALAGEAEYNVEFRVIHPDRSIHFLKGHGVVMRDAQGNPQRMIGVNFDITAQKQAEQTIRQQIEKETLLRQITQHIRETLDLQRIFETACQDIRQFIQSDRVGIFRFYPDSGYDDGEFVAESLKEGFSSVLAIQVHDHCFGEDYAQRYTEGHFHAINDVLHSDLQDCHKAALSRFEIRANLVIPLVRSGKLWGLLCIHTCTAPRIWQPDEIDVIQQIAGQLAIAIQQADLFEQLQQEQEKLTQTNQALAHSNDDLARVTRLKDEFLANMSHELRTPLNAILGMSESIQETDLSQRQENAVKLIEKSGRHLLDLINDILDLSKIEAGKLELTFSSAPVNILCENSTILVKQMAFSKNIQLHTRIAENIRLIWVDERRIRQVLINLLSNAIKFTPSGGHITLAVELEEPEIVFSVTDTGIGITPENLSKLFQPFVQIDSNLNRQYMGTGLGLALVERIVTGHGGTVSVTSTFGEGSCFAIRLPYSSSSSVMNPPLESSEVGPTLTPIPDSLPCLMPLILIADDNLGNIQTMEDYLGNKGYRMLLASNGIEAVEMTKIHKPDVILMDIQMPLLDGLQATAQIRSDPAIAHIPIIALTALVLPGDKERCLAAGVNEYLVKPVRFTLLIEMIQKFYQNQESL